MARYVKRPLEIEAVEWTGDFVVKDVDTSPEWVREAFARRELVFDLNENDQNELYVETMEGTMHANVGDYIVKGVEGELYPVNGEIFRKTYLPSGCSDELAETATLMSSDDYKDRFRAEAEQVRIRHERLCSMLERWDAGALDFEPMCPREMLGRQAKAMSSYLTALEQRAEIEGIDLSR